MPATNSNPGTNTVLKEEIRQALKAFKGGNLSERARGFFNILGYLSERTLELGGEPQSFIDRFASPTGKRGTQTEQFLLQAATAIHIIFQITDEEIKSGAKQDSFLDEQGFYEGQAKTFLYVAVELKPGDYARGKYAGMTREISKRFGMPVCVLFRNGERITLAFAHRRASRKPGDADREVLEKVSLIREINEANPHRAHLDILAELSLGDRLLWMEKNQKSINFDGLLAAWLAKLDTEELNNRFYEELFDWFQWAVKAVNFPCPKQKPVPPEDHVIRLITRILFVWFIKEKQLVAEDLFIENKIGPLLKKYTRDNDDYYRAVLQNLFFATLNTEIVNKETENKRDFSKEKQKTHRNFNLYRYKDLLENPDELKRLMEQTPFINGGLFDCLDSEAATTDDGYRLDCFSDNKKHRKQLSVPNRLFFDDSRGLFPLLNKYKFTVEENTPIEQEVALDPELLGKVFENLLSAYNPETRETARKQTASYYTPRTIVGYMVDQALVASLAEKVKPTDGDEESWRERLCYLLDYAYAFDDAQKLFDEEEVKGIVKAISEIKVLDPAVGSGAFPMGILHKLTLALRRIDPDNKSWEELQKERARQKANDAFDTKDDDARREQLSEISETFKHYRDSDFGRKLYLIQNSIFGVDIQPVACQIAKLRFFISLTIEQTPTGDKSKNFGIKPLPNLETRFIAADTLIGLRLTGKVSLQSPAIKELEEELKQNREQHFNAKTRQKKLDCSKKDRKLRRQLAETLEEHYQRNAVGNEAKRVVDEETNKLTRQLSDYRNKFEAGKQETLLENTGAQQNQNLWDAKIAELEVAIVKKRELVNAILQQDESVKSSVVWRKAEEVIENRNVQIHAESEKISQWDPYDQNAKADWFDREYMFGVTDGFDIVIGNPPYIQLQKNGGRLGDLYQDCNFQTFARAGDIYQLFYEQGMELLKEENGILAFITSNSWMRAQYGRKLREFFSTKARPLQLIDVGKDAFDAIVDTNILLAGKGNTEETCKAVDMDSVSDNSFPPVAKYWSEIRPSGDGAWSILSPAAQKIKLKVEQVGTPLKGGI